MTCSTCDGNGVYTDQKCLDLECAHGDVLETHEVSWNKNSNWKKYERKTETVLRKRVMPCPRRPCYDCPAGEAARARIKRQVARQEERFALCVDGR